jgi:hypothetical protein
MSAKKKGCAHILLVSVIPLTGLCLVLAAVSALINRGLPSHSSIVDRPGHAKQLVPRGKFDKTLIPTYGVAIGNRMILHYMAVLAWGNPGEWALNESGLAYSDDDGQTWVKDPQMKWKGRSNFGQVAFVKHEDFLYLFGIPGGRLGGVKLARVEQAKTFDMSAYRYYAGTGEQGAQWVEDEAAAVLIVPPQVGELSVMWNEYLGRWIMTYPDNQTGGLVIREAVELWGPWSAALPLVSARRIPAYMGLICTRGMSKTRAKRSALPCRAGTHTRFIG